ncbi:MAG: aldo/keto reductase [Methylobacteriaceae bacterium]|nr:aldo/keto reductase [Methylobacteriaceae bacterium]
MSAAGFLVRPGYEISRVIRGGWQLAGGHGNIDRMQAAEDLLACFDAGIFAFDCADIYTGVEEIYGAFRRELARRRGREALARLKLQTKFVPDLDLLPKITKSDVSAVIDQSLRRLGTERLDLVQFHWWDYRIPGCVETALWLDELRRDGKIELVGGTNFNAAHVEALVAAGVPLATMQVQYSLIDLRPQKQLVATCRRHAIHLLCYGAAAGGFFSERWLGAPEPGEPFENRSLRKYKLVIDDFGGWSLFQELLVALRRVGERHDADIATVASRLVLDRPMVAAVIIGGRNCDHLASNRRIPDVQLTEQDRTEIDAVLACAHPLEGDVFDLERDRTGRHGSIMKYNLNATAA